MDSKYTEIMDIIKDEIHELHYLNIKFVLNELNHSSKNIHHPFQALAIQTNKLDENGNRLLDYTVKLCTNPHEIFDIDKKFQKAAKVSRVRFEEYLINIGSEWNQYTQFICFALHEIGHIKLYELYRYYGMFEAYSHANKIFQSTIDISLSFKNMKKHYSNEDVDLRYHLNPSELNADNFVYIKFPRIWNRVKEILKEEQ